MAQFAAFVFKYYFHSNETIHFCFHYDFSSGFYLFIFHSKALKINNKFHWKQKYFLSLFWRSAQRTVIRHVFWWWWKMTQKKKEKHGMNLCVSILANGWNSSTKSIFLTKAIERHHFLGFSTRWQKDDDTNW